MSKTIPRRTAPLVIEEQHATITCADPECGIEYMIFAVLRGDDHGKATFELMPQCNDSGKLHCPMCGKLAAKSVGDE